MCRNRVRPLAWCRRATSTPILYDRFSDQYTFGPPTPDVAGSDDGHRDPVLDRRTDRLVPGAIEPGLFPGRVDRVQLGEVSLGAHAVDDGAGRGLIDRELLDLNRQLGQRPDRVDVGLPLPSRAFPVEAGRETTGTGRGTGG